MSKKIKVLIVDDSAFMRRVIHDMLDDDLSIDIIGSARDGLEGVQMAMDLKPDVITMDIEMPRMNGLDAISAIMNQRPTPIIVLSSLSTEGATVTFEALDRGALDYISKNLVRSALDVLKIKEDLISKVKSVATKMPKLPVKHAIAKPVEEIEIVKRTVSYATQRMAAVCIGTSTGGPKAIQEIIPALPGDIGTTIIVAVHMPREFTGPFADRINNLSQLHVKEAQDGEILVDNTVYVCPGGTQTRIKRKSPLETEFYMSDKPSDSLYKPSIDITMSSIAETFPSRTLGIILTGMGHDGLEGLRKIQETGGKTMAQDKASATVYGMNKSVIEAGVVDKISSLDLVAAEIVNMI